MRTAAWSDSVSVLDRLSAVLDAFGDDGEGVGISELARRANLPKSTVSRIAADLVDEGYLDRADGRLFLGIRLFELGQSVDRPRELRHAAQPTMTRLRDATGHDVHLAITSGADAIVIASARGSDPRHIAARIGEPLPRDATALGAAFAALGPESGAEDSIVTAYEARHGDHVCVASPILERGEIVAALSVSGMIDVLDPVAAAPLVHRSAGLIGRRITRG